MKIIINQCFGGYGLSEKAIQMYIERAELKLYRYTNNIYTTIPVDEYKSLLSQEEQLRKECPREFTGYHSNKFCWSESNIARDDKLLIQIVEELGVIEASGSYAKLKIVEIPDNIKYIIEEYDGYESISEKHRTWGRSSENNSDDTRNNSDDTSDLDEIADR